MQSRRTDLAMELAAAKGKTTGIERQVRRYGEKDSAAGIEEVCITVHTEEVAKQLGKPRGTYLSLCCADMAGQSGEALQCIARRGAAALLRLADWQKIKRVLVVGLGNRSITPDAYGPKVCDKLFVTQHMFSLLPQGSYREVCAFVPGVMGATGLPTAQLVQGVCSEVRPDLVVAVDALASEQTSRIGRVLQMSNTGIAPGSGLGNAPHAIDEETLGIPVLAVGVPTVTYAGVVAQGLAEAAFSGVTDEAQRSALERLLQRIEQAPGAEYMVAPKHMDILTEKAAALTAAALNLALHPHFDPALAAQLAD